MRNVLFLCLLALLLVAAAGVSRAATDEPAQPRQTIVYIVNTDTTSLTPFYGRQILIEGLAFNYSASLFTNEAVATPDAAGNMGIMSLDWQGARCQTLPVIIKGVDVADVNGFMTQCPGYIQDTSVRYFYWTQPNGVLGGFGEMFLGQNLVATYGIFTSFYQPQQ